MHSDESNHPDKSLTSQAFLRMSPNDLGVFVFARQAAAAGVSGSSSNLGNVYGSAIGISASACGGRADLTSYALSFGQTAIHLMKDRSNAAPRMQFGSASGSSRAGRGRVRVPRTHLCTVRARRLWRTQRALPMPIPQGSTKWQAAARVGGAASRFGLPAMPRRCVSVPTRCTRLR